MARSGSVAVAGYGDAYADEENVKDPKELCAEATLAAVDDAGIELDDVDAIFTGREPKADHRPQWNNVFASYLNVQTTLSTSITNHAAGTVGALKYAMSAIEADLVDTVLVVHGDSSKLFTDPGNIAAEWDAHPEFESPFRPWMPSFYAMMAHRYLHETDTTREQMARIAVELRQWGTRHPKAAMYGKGEISVEDVLDSRTVSSPLNLLDCAMWYPGGTAGALILTDAHRGAQLTDEPLYLRGVGEFNTHENVVERVHVKQDPPGPGLTWTGAAEAARQSYRMAGMDPSDIDLVQAGVNFTHIGLMLLEELGFCQRGTAGRFVANGGIDFDDGLPYCPNGGMLNFGEPGPCINMDSLIEAVRQLRGDALGVQVPDAETALVHGPGGANFACNAVGILSTNRSGGAV